MGALARIALFTAVLAAAFAAAIGVGYAVGPLERGVAAHEEPGHKAAQEHGAASALGAPAGLSLAANGFRLDAERTTFEARRPSEFEFDVAGARRFDVVHARRLHLILVRRDLAFFQHLHPRRTEHGAWTTQLRLPAPGVYRAFADFSADGKRTVLGVDLFVPGRWEPRALRQPTRARSSDGYAVTLRGVDKLRFRIERAGREVAAGLYLGARGHLVVLRAGDLAYVHTHPEAHELAFDVELPTPGVYRAFLQYRHGGRVRTAAFLLRERP